MLTQSAEHDADLVAATVSVLDVVKTIGVFSAVFQNITKSPPFDVFMYKTIERRHL